MLVNGIADSQRCCELSTQYRKHLLTLPRKWAKIIDHPSYQSRYEAIKTTLGPGADPLARLIWAKLTGYSKRALIESVIARWKRLFGAEIASYHPVNIAKEVRLKAMMIHEVIDRQTGLTQKAY